MRTVLTFAMALGLLAGTQPAIERATLTEPKAVTPEVSTEELVGILAEDSVPVLDVRSPCERDRPHPGQRQPVREGG